MALLYSKFEIFSSLQLLPPLPQLTEISEMLTNLNYYTPTPVPPISDFNYEVRHLKVFE